MAIILSDKIPHLAMLQEDIGTKSVSQWNTLPADLVAFILKGLGDYGVACMRLTCKAWCQAQGMTVTHLTPANLNVNRIRQRYPLLKSLDVTYCFAVDNKSLDEIATIETMECLNLAGCSQVMTISCRPLLSPLILLANICQHHTARLARAAQGWLGMSGQE